MGRDNVTSIRYSDRVKKIVNKGEGKTFVDKFEFICIDFEDKRKSRCEKIKELDKQIKNKEKEVEKLYQKIYSLRSVESDLRSLFNNLKEYEEEK